MHIEFYMLALSLGRWEVGGVLGDTTAGTQHTLWLVENSAWPRVWLCYKISQNCSVWTTSSKFTFYVLRVVCFLEKAMAPHPSTLAWKTPWMEEPGRLQSMGSLRVGHDWATSLSLFTFHFHAVEKEVATHSQCSCLENPRDGGAWWAAVYGVAQSRTRLKQLRNLAVCFYLGW